MPVTVTPTGPLSLAIDSAETLIANSATFRTAVGAASVAVAKDSIYMIDAPDVDTKRASGATSTTTKPVAIINAHDLLATIVDQTDYSVLMCEGKIVVCLTADVPSSYQSVDGETAAQQRDRQKDALMTFCNQVGGIFDDCSRAIAVAYTEAAHIQFKEIRWVVLPRRSPREHRGSQDYFVAIFTLDY